MEDIDRHQIKSEIAGLSTLRVTSTSYLLPNNTAWQPLESQYQLTYGSYGDYQEALANPNTDCLAFVLFLPDLIDAGSHDSFTNMSIRVDALLESTETALYSASNPLIVAFSGWRPGHPISQASRRSEWTRLCRYFIERIYHLAEKYSHLYCLDLDHSFSAIGLDKCLDNRNYYASHCRLSTTGLNILARSLRDICVRFDTPPLKLLVLDCDNTLWGNVLGEVGIEGILLGTDGAGEVYTDFQRAIKSLSHDGVMLALSTKNNSADIVDLFNNHPGMVLEISDFVAVAANWDDKASNIENISRDLGIGHASIGFWDDNPFERGLIKRLLPQIQVFDVPSHLYQWPSFLLTIPHFARFQETAEDKTKTDQYKSRAKFFDGLTNTNDPIDFLHSINQQLILHSVDQYSIVRTHQLLTKTNQFNLTFAKPRQTDLLAFSKTPLSISFLAELNDSYGNHGIVATVLSEVAGKDALLGNLVLSCRVIGRHLEEWLLGELKRRLIDHDIQQLYACYVTGPRNEMAKTLLPSLGFEQVSDEHQPRLVSRFPFFGAGYNNALWYQINVADLEAKYDGIFSVR